MFAPLALVAALVAAPCRPTGALKVYIEADAVRPNDSTMTARLCLTVPANGARPASLSGRLRVDTAFATIDSVSRPARSAFLANAASDGSVLVAGAAGNGMAGGTVLTIRLRLLHAGVLPRIDFTATELNGADGHSLVTSASIAGLAARCIGGRAAVFEVLPPVASVDPGEPLDLRITGCGFSTTRNTVRFGDVKVENVRSAGDGTRLRVIVPKELRAAAEVPPMALGPGIYDVSVDNGRGASNARRVTLR